MVMYAKGFSILLISIFSFILIQSTQCFSYSTFTQSPPFINNSDSAIPDSLINIGIDKIGSLNSSLLNSDQIGLNVPSSIIPYSANQFEFIISIEKAGSIYISIADFDGVNFSNSLRLGPFQVKKGINSIPVLKEIQAGQIVGFSGGSARIHYAGSGNGANSFWQINEKSFPAIGNKGSFYSYYIKVNRKNLLKTNIQKPLTAIIGNIRQNSFARLEPNTYYTISNGVAKQDSQINKLRINCQSAGTVIFSIASIDQNLFVIEDRVFKLTVKKGLNEFDLNEKIMEGQSLLIKSSTVAIGFLGSSTDTYLKSGNQGFQDNLVQVNGSTIAYQYICKPILQNDKTKTIANRDSEKSKTSLSKMSGTSYDEVIVIGNSLAQHGINTNIGWWGKYGMAASKRENDLAHILQKKLSTHNPDIRLRVRATNDWEASVTKNVPYDYTKLDEVLGDPALKKAILIRLGDNVRDNFSNYSEKCRELLSYIQKYCNNKSVIVATGDWYTSNNRGNSMELATKRLGIKFIPISDLNTTENKSKIDEEVTGDDHQMHRVFNPGVASHPGDKGHQAIAERAYDQF